MFSLVEHRLVRQKSVILLWTGVGVGRGLVPHVVDVSESESPQQESSEYQGARQGGGGVEVDDEQDSGDADRVEVPDDEDVADVLRLGVTGSGDTAAGIAGDGSLADSDLL